MRGVATITITGMEHIAQTLVGRVLDDMGVGAERVGPREWALRLPSDARGSVAVGIACGERTVTVRAFFMRAPDRDHAAVYRRVLRKNHDMHEWRFCVDDAGDLFLVASVPAVDVTEERLDDLLGLLVVYVDETFEATVRAGFDIPPGVSVSGPPPRPSP